MAMAGACLATPVHGQFGPLGPGGPGGGPVMVEPDLAHRWRFSVGSGATDHDVANGVAIQRVGLDFGTPQRLAGTIITVGDKRVGAASHSAWVTFDGGTPASGAVPDPTFHQTLEYGGAGGRASAQDVAAAPFWTRREKHAHVVGWFDGTVDFGGVSKAGGGVGTSGYLAFFRQGVFPTAADWVARFHGGGEVKALTVDVTPKCRPAITGGDTDPPLPGARTWNCDPLHDDVILVGGYFDTSIDFFDYDDGRASLCGAGIYGRASNGGEDGFIAAYTEGWSVPFSAPHQGGLFRHVTTIGGAGDDRVNGIVVDQVDNVVIATGFFSQSVDFNPNPFEDPHVKTAVGGKDIFVARYTWENSSCPFLVLDWVYTYGTPYDDEGLDVAVDLNGDVYAVGYHTPSGVATRRDMFVAKIKREQASRDAIAQWTFNHHQRPGDQVATGVAVDGLDRVLVTGRFGCPHANQCEHLGGQYDFDPGAGTDIRVSNGGGDIFVARYYPANGLYDGVFTFGGSQHDEGTAIAIDPVHTQTVAHTGFFGYPGAPSSGYTIDLDPDPGVTSTVESTGGQDGFCSLLRTDWITEDLKNMVAIVLDSTTHTRYPHPSGPSFDEFTKMTWTYADRMGLDIPQDGTAAVAIFIHGLGETYGLEPGMGGKDEYDRATQVMPWTVLDAVNRPLFASALRAMPRWRDEGTEWLDASLKVVRESFRDSPLSDVACFRSIHLLSGGPNQNDAHDGGSPTIPGPMRIARDGTVGAGSLVNRIDGFGVPHFNYFADPQTGRDYFLTYATASEGPDPRPFHAAASTAASPGNYPSFSDPAFESLVSRLLARVGYCPGDFNLDGDVDGFDLIAFDDARDPLHPDHARTDWDFDGTPGTPDDWTAFVASHAQGCCQ